jgi:hypothetical protein
MMRRSLQNIVPTEILERRRKGYISRGPLALLRERQARIETILSESRLESDGFVHKAVLSAKLREALCGSDGRWAIPILRTVDFDLWHRGVKGVIAAHETPVKQVLASDNQVRGQQVPGEQISI